MSDDGLRAIFIATYAASWIAEIERLRRGDVELGVDIAVRAVNAATEATLALRDAYLGNEIRGSDRIAMVRDALGEDLVDRLDAARSTVRRKPSCSTCGAAPCSCASQQGAAMPIAGGPQ